MADGTATAIRVCGVSRAYRLFASHRHRLLEAIHPLRKRYHRTFWALKDVSFDVRKGATVGIIGPNGSGKSTLLAIICGILRPTNGTAEVAGSVSSLLELGTGFNPELTGRENVIFNGRLKGLSEKEITRRLPRVEAFADIGDFVSQPVKTYSSGMYVRLAFSAAIHVDADILVIDEALSVGDAKFQHKCFQKFLEFQRMGKTILFVSHDTNAIVKYCSHAILLDHGKVLERGEPNHVANCYYELLFTGKIDGYVPYPEILIEGYKGFNIIRFGRRFFALARALGPIDLDAIPDSILSRYQSDRLCAIAPSEEGVLQAVDELVPEAAAWDDTATAGVYETARAGDRAQDAVEQFVRHVPEMDMCPQRGAYNKNEHRFGDRRAEIVDCMITCGDRCDPPAVYSGDTLDIYIKARVKQRIERPMFGLAVKTVDGVMVFGMNTRLLDVELAPADAGEIVIGKLTVTLDVHWGDYFLDLGIAEKEPAEDVPIDIRCGMIYVVVQEKQRFDGFAGLACSFEPVARRTYQGVSTEQVGNR